MYGDLPTSVVMTVVFSHLLPILIIFVLYRHIRRLRRVRNTLLQEKDLVLNFVYDLGEVFVEEDNVDPSSLLKKVLSYALRTTGGRAGALYMVDRETQLLSLGAVNGVFPPLVLDDDAGMDAAFSKVRYLERLVRKQRIEMGKGLIGEVALRGSALLIPDAKDDDRVPRYQQEFLKIGTILIVPMRFRREVLGVIAVTNRLGGEPFTQDDLDLLQALADEASVPIHYAEFSSALAEKRRLDRDLSVAAKIQSALLPKEIPRVEGFDLAAFSVPAQEIGGDYYDFVHVDENHLGIAIADVAGKGVSGAIVMSICRSILRIEAEGCLSPALVVREVNRRLSRDLSEDMFVSMLYMVLDIQTRELVFARAGHAYPIVIADGSRKARMLKSGGIALGLADPETFDEVLEEDSLRLKSGDMVVGYTDGVTEAHDRNENEWGVLSLVTVVERGVLDGKNAAGTAGLIRDNLLSFVSDTPQYDDMTVVAVSVS